MKFVVFLLAVLPLAAAIQNGNTAELLTSLPWQVYLKITKLNPWYPWDGKPQILQSACGGSIIGSRWILTAQHCTDGVAPADIQIVTGEYNTAMPEFQEATYFGQAIFPAAGYNFPYPLANDMALIQTSADIIFDAYRQPIALAAPGDDLLITSMSNCQISGWGMAVANGPSHNLLQYINVMPVDKATCQMWHNTASAMQMDQNPSIVDFQHICVTSLASSGACYGDSGGPMACVKTIPDMFGNPINTPVLMGVTSTGIDSCVGAPSIYESVPYFYNWIVSTMNNNIPPPPPPPAWPWYGK